MFQIQNSNLAENKSFLEKGKTEENILKSGMIILTIAFPWLFFLYSKPLELLKQSFLLLIVGVMLVVSLVGIIKKGTLEWRRNRFNWVVIFLSFLLGVLFLYSNNHQISWEGYQGSFTSGVSEYVTFFIFYLLGTQFFSKNSWRQNLEMFIFSLSASSIFLVMLAYFGKSEFITANFARTPSLVVAVCGVTSLALWWTVKVKEKIMDWLNLFSALALLFISSVLDYTLSWWVWAAGTGIIVFFDFLFKHRGELERIDQRQLGIPLPKNGSFLRNITKGKGKYLFFVFLFSFSQATSPLILHTEKVSFMPYYSALLNHPILLDKILFYLVLEFFILVFGIVAFLSGKTEKNLTLAISGSLFGIMTGQLLYYSESTLLYFLIWMLFVFASLTFLRKQKELDYLREFKVSGQGKKAFAIFAIGISIIILVLVFLRGISLFN